MKYCYAIWNNPSDYEIFCLSGKMWNKINPSYAAAYFIASAISYATAYFTNPARDLFHWKEPTLVVDKCGFFSGGRRWIRTTEVVDNRFTVCPLWPLGNSPLLKWKWSWWTDSNPRPADYKSAALPTELHQRVGFALNASDNIAHKYAFVKPFFEKF